jgi:hypothetical protein
MTSWSPAANALPAMSRSLMREGRTSMHLGRWRSRAPDLSDVAHAALRGAIASMAMTGMRVVTVSLGLVDQAPPQQLAGESRGTRRALVELAHWGFGALAAAGFGALPSGWRARPWTGPVYGLVIWTGFEATAPLLGLPHAAEAGVTQRLAIAADHALYGFVLDETRRAPQA